MRFALILAVLAFSGLPDTEAQEAHARQGRGRVSTPEVLTVADGILQRTDVGDFANYEEWRFLRWFPHGSGEGFGAVTTNDAGMTLQFECWKTGGTKGLVMVRNAGGEILVRDGRAATLSGVGARNLARHLFRSSDNEAGDDRYSVELGGGVRSSFPLAGARSALRRMADSCGVDLDTEWEERDPPTPPPDVPGGGIVLPDRPAGGLDRAVWLVTGSAPRGLGLAVVSALAVVVLLASFLAGRAVQLRSACSVVSARSSAPSPPSGHSPQPVAAVKSARVSPPPAPPDSSFRPVRERRTVRVP